MKKSLWLERRKASLCLMTAVCIISLFVILSSGRNVKLNESDYYSVTIRHYGLNAAEMERTVTIPLEDAMSEIPGVISVQSSSENGISKVLIHFSRRVRSRGGSGHYSALREAAQMVYECLPQSAQRPLIQSADSSRIPVWSAVVTGDDSEGSFNIEKILKPRLESLEGVGEVLISGIGIREVVVTLDQEKIASMRIVPSLIAMILAKNDMLFSGGLLVQGDHEFIISVDGRYGSGEYDDISALGAMPVLIDSGTVISLSDIATIVEQERRPDSYSRINGKETVGIAIMAGSGVDLRSLSGKIKNEINDPSLPFTFTVLSDRGAEEAAALRSVFSAVIQGALMVAIVSFLLNRRRSNVHQSFVNYSGLFCALSVPVVCLLSAAVLSAYGLPLNRIVLAGIAAGIGSAVDSIIICSAKLKHCKSHEEARTSLKTLCNPLVAGSVTTVAVLLPIMVMDAAGKNNAGIIAMAIAAVTLIALLVSIGPLPPLLLWELNSAKRKQEQKCRIKNKPGIFRKIQRTVNRFLAANTGFCIKYPLIIVTAGLIIFAAGLTALYVRGADSGEYTSGNSIYARIEFEGGLLAEETDLLLAAFGESLVLQHGIVNVETVAKTGSGSALIAFDPQIINPEKARNNARQFPIPGAFLFFPESTSKENHWTITVSGDDSQKCREIAEETAFKLSASPLVMERVLNFKQGSPRIDLVPDREKLALSGISFAGMANSVRQAVFGPVVYKRLSSAGEIDVRVRMGGNAGQIIKKDQIPEIIVIPQNREDGYMPVLHIDSAFSIIDGYEPSSIRRENRRRTASITITTKAMDPRRVKDQVSAILDRIELPPGYSIEFDPEAIRQAQALSGTVFFFFLALLFCFMVLGAVNESFFIPLVIIFSVLPSLAIPALILSISGFPFNTAAACAFIAVSGMSVNASVLCAGGLQNASKPGSIYRSLRRNFPALFAMTATTIAGTIPFLFLRESENTLVRTIAFVTALGVGCSTISAVSIVPALMNLFNKNRMSGK
ncbi:MAG: efflux RND transporter permease subunit [Treponema sp.]|nr:efflux RND transporter permease subunit [Treponema sp.]